MVVFDLQAFLDNGLLHVCTLEEKNIEGLSFLHKLLLCDLFVFPKPVYCRSRLMAFVTIRLLDVFLKSKDPLFSDKFGLSIKV